MDGKNKASSPKSPTKRKNRRRKQKSKIAHRWNPTNDKKAPPKKEMSMMLQNLTGAVAKKKEDLKHTTDVPEKKEVVVGKIDTSNVIPKEKPAARKQISVGKLVIDENPEQEPEPVKKPLANVGKLDMAHVEEDLVKSVTPAPAPKEPVNVGKIDMDTVNESMTHTGHTPPPDEGRDPLDFGFDQAEIIVDDNRVIPPAKPGVNYEEDVYVNDEFLHEALRHEKSNKDLKDWLEMYVRAKYIIFEFHDWDHDSEALEHILGAFANATFQVEGLYFFHVGSGLGHSGTFIRHCREFIAMNHLTLRELVFNTVGSCHKMFLWMPACPKLAMVSFDCVELDVDVFRMIAKQPSLKHIVISGGHDNDFETEEFVLAFLKAVGNRIITLGLDDPHFESSVEFFDKMLPLMPHLRVFGAKEWIGGQKSFVKHMHVCKNHHRITEMKTRALGELFPQNYRWWEFVKGWKIKVLAEAKH